MWPLWPVLAGGLAALVIGVVGLATARLDPAAVPVAAGNLSTGPANAASSTVVTNVLDGDTVEVTGPLSATVQVLGIDAPEHPGPACGAAQSREFAVRTLQGQTVTLVRDPGQPAVDRKGRTLGYLRLPDGSDYSVRAAAAGMATYFDGGSPVSSATEIKAAQDEAERGKQGLWGRPCNGIVDGPATSAAKPR